MENDEPIALAHVSEAGTQSLEDHLLGVSSLAETYGEKLGVSSAAALLGILHDLGKASPEFQSYICSFLPDSERPRNDLRGKIDHSTAGAQILLRKLSISGGPGREFAHLLALCIASHHSGLIDCVAQDGEDCLERRLTKPEEKSHAETSWSGVPGPVRAEAERLLRDGVVLAELRAKLAAIVSEGPGRSPEQDDRIQVQIGLFVRLLFSCLIDADRTDTADNERSPGGPQRQHGRYESWDVLLARLQEALGAFPCVREIDRLRRQVSEDCFVAAKRATGAYTLTVPTGGGKTLAALRFALEHARIHRLDRVIFVSPFISIVDQNAAVAREILEPSELAAFASIVLEHHSNLIDENEGGIDGWRRRLLAENWDAPVVFTTMAQVLESLFGSGTRSVRRLHALARSVIVFDEAQTLPIKMVHLFNNAVNLLVAHCGCTALLCTATQPLLGHEQVDGLKGRLKLAARPELVDARPDLFGKLKRYVVQDQTRRPGGWDLEQVAKLACEQASEHMSCLVIVNTKRDAREIFTMCRKILPDAHLAHLSTGMCPAHRMERLRDLRKWLQLQKAGERPGNPILCVSTQLIEAGVDIDFASVIRDLAGLDSLAQAAGRCNRNGERINGVVTVVRLPLPKSLDDIQKDREAAETILSDWRRKHPGAHFPLHDPAPMSDYFIQSFYNRRDEMSYCVRPGDSNGRIERNTTLLSMLGANRPAVRYARESGKPIRRVFLHQSFSTANDCFHLVGETQGIIVPFREAGRDVINRILSVQNIELEWGLLREAQRYTVSVYPRQLRQLCDKGAVYTDARTPGLYFLRAEFYDDYTGLRGEAGLMGAQVV